MGKDLSEMTIEELWELFPIELNNHHIEWSVFFSEERAHLIKVLGNDGLCRINHIGSTFVTTIQAKPIIDILIEYSCDIKLSEISQRLQENGYLEMNKTDNRISLNKGYTSNGFAKRVFHIHLRYIGDCDELYFRDYLVEHPDIAYEYEVLKIDLSAKYRNNRDAYTEQKTELINKYTMIAKKLYSNKYN